MKGKRALSIIPLTLLFGMLSLAGDPQSIPVEVILKQSILGSFSYGDISTLVLTVENLWFLIFFPLLYGGYIAGSFQCGSNYTFSRIKHRSIWYRKRIISLLVCDVIYSGGYLTVMCVFSSLRSTFPFGCEALKQAFWMFLLIIMWNLEITLLVNVLALKCNILVGFFVGYISFVTAIIFAVKPEAANLNRFINPIYIAEFEYGMSMKVMEKFGVNLIYCGVLFTIGKVTVNNHDILYVEQE